MSTSSDSPKAPEDITAKFLLRMVTLALVIFVSGSSAVSVGFRSALHDSQLVRQEGFRNDSYLNVAEPFPNYELWDTGTKDKLTVSDLLANGSALFIFINTHCGACQRLTPQFNRHIMAELRSKIQVVCVYDDADWYAQTAVDTSLTPKGSRVMTMDRTKFVEEDGITATPTLVGIDRDGIVIFVASGFNRARITAKFLQEELG